MNFVPNECYHLYNRGNNRQSIFFKEDNYLFFIKKMRDQLAPYCEIICYCLMPNHFHIVIQANEESTKERNSFGGNPMQELPYRIGILLSSYSQAINKQNGKTGSLFQQKTKSKILSEQIEDKQENYLENCFFYVHNNPIEAGLANKPEDWQWSSYPDYAEVRQGTLCNKKLFFELTGLSKNDIITRAGTLFTEDEIRKFY